MAPPRPVLRFAPTPNGELHLGHALSAITNAEMAHRLGGRLLVRLEDIDTTRSRPEFEAGVLADLAWLGLSWEQPVRRQSDHFDDYSRALRRLGEMGLIYPSFLSRAEIKAEVERLEASGTPWPRDPDGAPLYPGQDRDLSQDDAAERMGLGWPHVFRLDMTKALARVGTELLWTEVDTDGNVTGTVAADPAAWGDVVLARKDAPTSYHLAVVVDDALQGITHVVRGMDLQQATAVHRVLQVLLRLPEPLYHHHALVLGADGRKLAKSEQSKSLASLRAEGATPDDIRRMVADRG